MKRAVLYALSAVCAVLSAVFFFALVGYKFSALILFAFAVFFAFLAFCCNTQKKFLHIARRAVVITAVICTIAGGTLVFLITSGLSGDTVDKCNYIIVLGAGINGRTPSLTLSDRLCKAEELMQKFSRCTAIVSGAQAPDEEVSESEVMKAFLVSHGIDKSRIIEEKRAENTQENIRFSLDIINSLEDSKAQNVVVVSSDYHMFRAKYISKKLGLEPIMASAETSLPVLRINYIMREAAALVKTYREMLP